MTLLSPLSARSARAAAVLLSALLLAPEAVARQGARTLPTGPPSVYVPGRPGQGPGTVFARRKLSTDVPGFPDTLDPTDNFGRGCALLGDIDGDGVSDIAVASREFRNGNGLGDGISARGAVFVVFLQSDGGVKGYRRIDNYAPGFEGQLDGVELFGDSLTALGDLDGDGVPDLAATSATDSISQRLWLICLTPEGGVKSFTRHVPGGDTFLVAGIGDVDGDGVPDLAKGLPLAATGFRGAVEILFLTSAGEIRSMQRIDATHGGFTGTLTNNDRFGASLAGLGDFDGDGVRDLAVGASGHNGAVWTLLLNANGTVKSNVKWTGFTGLGTTLAAVGDLNQDSLMDLVSGEPTSSDGGSQFGAVWVYLMSAGGTPAASQKISVLAGGFSGTLHAGDRFGTSVAPVGDLDGDGTPDLLVGAPFDDDNGSDCGAAWALRLDGAGMCVGQSKISDRPGSLQSTLDPNDAFGRAVVVLGDLDGDGIPELAVGASGDDDGGADRGAVWIFFPDADGRPLSRQKVSFSSGGFGGGLDNLDAFGSALVALGDLDGDGVPDLGVGAPGDDDGGSARGALWILFLNADGTVRAQQKISSTAGGFTGALNNNDFLGTSLTLLGDLDGDGTPELAAGTPGHKDSSTANEGAVWLLSLATDGTVVTLREIGEGLSGFGGTLENEDFFGTSTAALGDLDGDGVGDLAVGDLPQVSIFGAVSTSGTVWILLLNADGTVKSTVEIDEGLGGFTGPLSDFDEFARSLAALGDLDGDGRTELAVGAPEDREGETLEVGAFWILSLDATGQVIGQVRTTNQQGMGGRLRHIFHFGRALAALGDRDGDGANDVLVGSPGAWDGGNQGAVWMLALDGVARAGFEQRLDAVRTRLANGNSLAPTDLGIPLTIESAGANLGAAIFDSTPGGPNDPGAEPDLLVGRGGLVILQDSLAPTQTVPGTFDQPRADPDGGTLVFRFPNPVAVRSLDLVDIDASVAQPSTVRLFDALGGTRTYSIPAGWTEDLVSDGPPAWRRLLLDTRVPQPGFAATATAAQVRGFDQRAVVRIEVFLAGAGALDELVWDPHP